MGEHNSPQFTAGIADGVRDALRSPRIRQGFDPARSASWMYKRGFARGFLAVRRAHPGLLAQMQRRLDALWDLLEKTTENTAP